MVARLRRKPFGSAGRADLPSSGSGFAHRRDGEQPRNISIRCRATISTDLIAGSPRVGSASSRCRELADVNSDQQNRGLQSLLEIDRDDRVATRVSAPQFIDDTLYDAFGQRQVSLIYTLLNQYHVVMEVAPEFWQRPDALRDDIDARVDGARCR